MNARDNERGAEEPGFECNSRETVSVKGRQTPIVRLRGPRMSAAIVPSQGAEVAALQVLHEGAWFETLHRALDYAPDPDEWGGHAPLQWPAVGRNSVQEQLDARQYLAMGSWRHEGKRFPIPILGFARFMEFAVADSGASDERAWVECRASACDYSRQYYPFEFELRYTHIMEERSLRSRCLVRNLETTRQLPFSIGNHITFHLPFTSKGSFEECVIVSPTTSHLELNANDLLSGRELPKDLRRGGTLADRELWNMVLTGFKCDEAAVELRDPHSFGLCISQRELGGAPRAPGSDIHFILYAERRFSSFCPEPWLGEPNSLNSGKGLIRLGPGEEFAWEMCVSPLTEKSGHNTI